MEYLYFDLIDGISGDMIVASLLDISKDFNYLKKELKKINLKEYEIKNFRCQSAHIRASRFAVKDLAKKRRVFQINTIKNKIIKSRLYAETKKKILDIYQTLYNAEKNVHGAGHVHFQQIGEVDSLIDIASTCILIDRLGVERILYSMIPFGERIAPATAYMLKSKDIYLSTHQYENITPTGIAIITTLGLQKPRKIGNEFSLQKFGYATGSIIPSHSSNILRTFLLKRKDESAFQQDEIVVIQCNIDDMNPQVLGFLMDRLYAAGALEVYYENYYTKKSRIGILISVLSKYETFDTIADIIFKETTTLGIRYFKVNRKKLKRKQRLLNTSLGKIGFKEVIDRRYKKIIPEYDDCVKVAKSKNMSLKDIMTKVSEGR